MRPMIYPKKKKTKKKNDRKSNIEAKSIVATILYVLMEQNYVRMIYIQKNCMSQYIYI
jgi:hypothetical protein